MTYSGTMWVVRVFGHGRVAALCALGTVTGGCSSSEAADSCVSGAGGEVCAVPSDGNVEIRAAGLQPASELTLEVEGNTTSYVVGADGAPTGTIALFAALAESVRVGVTAVTADGSALEGALTARR